MEKHKLVIIGSGPAGYTAAIYAARANLSPVLYQGFFSGIAGGQLMTTTEVENYPGFPKGITGPELMENFKAQAEKFGTRMITDDVESVNLCKCPFIVNGKKYSCQADAIIVATGATAMRLDVPGSGDGEFWQKGVSACAVCDGAMPIFRDKELFVIGGGDTAAEEALFLTKYASKVYLVHRRDKLRASKVMAKRVMEHPQIEILWNRVLERVEGDSVVRHVILKDVNTEKEKRFNAGGVFFAIGHTPNVSFLNGQIELEKNGYIAVKSGFTQTSVKGVFVAGDVADPVYKQAITAAGTGCRAALDVESWLAKREGC